MSKLDTARGPHDDDGGQAIIETVDGHDYITIRVPVAALTVIVDGVDMDCDRFRVVDPAAFAKDLVRVLNDSSTVEGPPRIHEALDQAILDAYDEGAGGCEP